MNGEKIVEVSIMAVLFSLLSIEWLALSLGIIGSITGVYSLYRTVSVINKINKLEEKQAEKLGSLHEVVTKVEEETGL